MAKKQDDTKYLVVEKNRITRKDEPVKMVTSLRSFWRKYRGFGSFEEFVKMALAGDMVASGLTVVEATDEQIKEHGGKPKIVAAAAAYNQADEIAKKTKYDNAVTLIEFIKDNVKTSEDLASFMSIYQVSSTQIMAMHKSVKDDGVELSEKFVSEYCALVAARSEKTGSPRSESAVRKAWDEPLKTKAKAA